MKFSNSGRAAVLGLATILAACTSGREGNSSAEVDIRGSDPNKALEQAGENTLNNAVVATADGAGIVTYDGYQTAEARAGDTVGTVADRIGLSASQLGAYNGLPATYALRPGDELALPPRPGGYGAGGASTALTAPASPEVPSTPTTAPVTTDGTQAAAIEQRPLGGIPVNEDGSLASETLPPGTVPGATSADPATPGATTIAPAAPAPWSPSLAAAAIERSSSGIRNDGSLGAPPSSAAPVPDTPEQRDLQSPGLSQYQTNESQGITPVPAPNPGESIASLNELQVANESGTSNANIRMRRPVEGPVAVGFNKGAGPARNDGVDFAAPAGAKVVAAADGEVALVSQSLGGLGTIVLVRHPNEILTVYGRIDGVLVQKGDIVSAGQQIGIVSNATAPAEPRMHFEVRRGSESLDPMLFL